MGLDAVELVMEYEKTFEIEIPHSAASKMLTVGQTYEFILRELERKGRLKGTGCRSAGTFYDVRRVLVGRFGVERHAVKRRSRLDSLIGRDGLREKWRQLRTEVGFKAPLLSHSPWTWLGIWIAAGTVAALSGERAIEADSPREMSLWMFVTIAGLVGVVVGAANLLQPLANRIPWRCETVEGLVHHMVSHGYVPHRYEDATALSRDDVWVMLRSIVAEQMGIEHAKVTLGSRYVEDLGV